MSKTTRRNFFKSGFASLFGIPFSKLSHNDMQQAEELKIQKYNVLGKTGLKVSDVSFGTNGASDPVVMTQAIEKGMNLFDTAPNYVNGEAEKAIGKALKGRRKGVIISSRVNIGRGREYKNQWDKAVNGILKRLQTDYLDILMIGDIGNRNDLDILKNSDIRETFDSLKKDGRIRFSGISGHGGTFHECMEYGLTNDMFDVLMPAFWVYLGDKHNNLLNILNEAKKREIGVIAMKTLQKTWNIRLEKFKDDKTDLQQACIKFALSLPGVTSVNLSIRNLDQIKHYISVSGATFSMNDYNLMKKYEEQMTYGQCTIGCSDCENACPRGIPVNDILRYSLYFKGYGIEKVAMQHYAQLHPSQKSVLCKDCSAGCESYCPNKVNIKNQLLEAHDLLTV